MATLCGTCPISALLMYGTMSGWPIKPSDSMHFLADLHLSASVSQSSCTAVGVSSKMERTSALRSA
eukprot:1623162-Lingulodinium_polyedra.AAC.1